MKVLLVFLGIIAVIVGLLATSYINAFNYSNSQEMLIKATVANNQNIYAQTGRKIQAIAKVPGMMKKDTVEVIKAAIEGRYGQDGSKQVFLAVKEMNPQLDVSLYKKIQDVIEASTNEFQAGQTILIDIRRQYQTRLGSFWGGFWIKLAGYPKINLDSQEFKPVTTEEASDTFKSGIQKPIELQ